MAEAILDKAQPKRARGGRPPRSAPGETPLPTKFYHPSRGGGEAPLADRMQHFERLLAVAPTAQPTADFMLRCFATLHA